jgi:hypothetical protein
MTNGLNRRLPPRVRTRLPPGLPIKNALHSELTVLIEQTVKPVIDPAATVLCLLAPNPGVIVRIADSAIHERLLAEGPEACLPICRALGEALLFDDVDLVIFERQVPDAIHEIVGDGWVRFWRDHHERNVPQSAIDRLYMRIGALYAALRRWPASAESVRLHVDRLVARALARPPA